MMHVNVDPEDPQHATCSFSNLAYLINIISIFYAANFLFSQYLLYNQEQISFVQPNRTDFSAPLKWSLRPTHTADCSTISVRRKLHFHQKASKVERKGAFTHTRTSPVPLASRRVGQATFASPNVWSHE